LSAAPNEIDNTKLPTEEEVASWDGETMASVIRHDPTNSNYNMHFRQLIHVGYKVAAQLGDTYTDALKKYSEVIGEQVTENLYDRHIKRIFKL